MNYRHAYHAGNHADVLKHILLTRILAHLRKKEKAFHCFDAHAGTGIYALSASEALKTNEFETGFAKMAGQFSPEIEALLEDYRQVVASVNKGDTPQYPGSPLFLTALTRPQDRVSLNELHPIDYDLLVQNFGHNPRVALSQIDALTLLKAKLPPPERRGLVLLDPPYELKNERDIILESLRLALRRFSSAIYLIWYPVKGVGFAEDMCQAIAGLAPGPLLRAELRIRESFVGGGLAGSGLLIVNPPWGLDQELNIVLPALAQRLGIGTWGQGLVEWLIADR